MNHDDYYLVNQGKLTNLIDNGFDFLESAIGQFKNDPKYSVINFCAAVELLLKARLMSEHWSLIVASNMPNLKEFKIGNFKSVGFKDLVPKIEAVTGEKIPTGSIESFNRLADHRNKVIHFFHEAYSANSPQKLLEGIALEQCNGWYHLRELLNKWDFIFEGYVEKIDRINERMKSYDEYIETLFQRIKSDLDKKINQGKVICECKRCRKPAAEELRESPYLNVYYCHVCHFEGSMIRVPCSEEGCLHFFDLKEKARDEDIFCEEGHLFDKSFLRDLLDSDPINHDNYFEHISINCAMCGETNSVVEHYDYYVCTECFYVTTDMEVCKWCNDGQIGGGDLSMSQFTGCEFCEGNPPLERADFD